MRDKCNLTKMQMKSIAGGYISMKKIIVALGLIFLSTTMAFAETGPIPLDLSNVLLLPDGQPYGTVTVTLLPDYCPSSYDRVEITVDANELILIPIENGNFGIQKFGFNYNGTPADLTLTGPTGWVVKKDQNTSEFGVFMEEPTGTGKTRQDPLVVKVCNSKKDLIEQDVIFKNDDGYTFVAHIADFKYDNVEYTTSAYFSTVKTAPPQTTLITLSSLTARASNGRVKIEWVTESEIDNAGFNIWRAEAEDGEYVKLNDEIISAKGYATDGAKYIFTDTIAKNRKTYFYKLEDVDFAGVSTFHGPVSATPKFLLGILNK
jgi:hypothetical protein